MTDRVKKVVEFWKREDVQQDLIDLFWLAVGIIFVASGFSVLFVPSDNNPLKIACSSIQMLFS